MRSLAVLCTFSALLASATASAWDPVRDIGGAVRRASSANLERLVKDVDKKQVAVEAAVRAGSAAQVAELKKQRAEAEAAVLEAERQVRIQIEERAIAKIESELPGRKTIPYRVDGVTYSAVINALYGASLEVQPMVYENYVFLTLDPHKLSAEDDGLLFLRMIVYWRKGVDRLTFRYAALEKRLRTAEPRPTTEPRLQSIADRYVESLAVALAKGGGR